jgi:hypothetical protein
MKYVVVAEPRYSGTPDQNMAGIKNLQAVFAKWEPPDGMTFLQFTERIDDGGAFIVVECDDPTLLAQVSVQFAPWVKSTVHPVVDVEVSVAASQRAIDWHDSL